MNTRWLPLLLLTFLGLSSLSPTYGQEASTASASVTPIPTLGFSIESPAKEIYQEAQVQISNLTLELTSLEKRRELFLEQKKILEAKAPSTPPTPETTASAASPQPSPKPNPALDPLLKILQHLDGSKDILDQIRLELDSILTELDQQDSLAKEVEEAQEELALVQKEGPKEKPPYSFLTLDSEEEDLRGELQSEGRIEASAAILRTALDQAKDAVSASNAGRRLARENLNAEANADRKPLLQTRLEEASLQARLDEIQLFSLRLQLKGQGKTEELHRLRLEFHRARIQWFKKTVQFTQEDLDKQKNALEQELEAVRSQSNRERGELDKAISGWNWLKREIDRKEKPAPGLIAKADAFETEIDSLRQRGVLRKSWEKWILERIRVWERRFELHHSQDMRVQTRQTWRQDSAEHLQVLERQENLQSGRRADIRKQLLPIERRLETQADLTSEARTWLSKQGKTLERLLFFLEEHQEQIDAAQRDHNKLLADLGVDETSWIPPRWKEILVTFGPSIWNFELAVLEDRPITIGKLIIALFLLGFGYFLARRVSRWIGGTLQERFHLDEGAAAGFESLSFYLLLIATTLLALNFANVPLTMFTLIGGALAIGFGFGTQNIINNFISGLILIAERPIRVGDLVEVDDTYGRIIRIGARCTQLRTEDHVDILVPNSSFLESNVTNLTLGDTRLRMRLAVGVAYGSDMDTAIRLLEEAAKGHEEVLPTPAPQVLFQDFGSSSLDLELLFWIRIKRSPSRFKIRSDLRLAIDRLYRENGIEIPFPQRDVHLDSLGPVSVVLENAPRNPSGDES